MTRQAVPMSHQPPDHQRDHGYKKELCTIREAVPPKVSKASLIIVSSSSPTDNAVLDPGDVVQLVNTLEKDVVKKEGLDKDKVNKQTNKHVVKKILVRAAWILSTWKKFLAKQLLSYNFATQVGCSSVKISNTAKCLNDSSRACTLKLGVASSLATTLGISSASPIKCSLFPAWPRECMNFKAVLSACISFWEYFCTCAVDL